MQVLIASTASERHDDRRLIRYRGSNNKNGILRDSNKNSRIHRESSNKNSRLGGDNDNQLLRDSKNNRLHRDSSSSGLLKDLSNRNRPHGYETHGNDRIFNRLLRDSSNTIKYKLHKTSQENKPQKDTKTDHKAEKDKCTQAENDLMKTPCNENAEKHPDLSTPNTPPNRQLPSPQPYKQPAPEEGASNKDDGIIYDNSLVPAWAIALLVVVLVIIAMAVVMIMY